MCRIARLCVMGAASGALGLMGAPLAWGAQVQPPTSGAASVAAVIDVRIEGDRSHVCVQAARIDLRGSPAVQSAAGCASPRGDAPAVGARFELGSISKVFVGVLAAEMVARGEVKLDEPLSALLPEGTGAPRSPGRPVTLADLLTHTASLPPLPPQLAAGADPANPYARLRADVVYAGLAELKLAAPPGTRYAYSNWAFLMLSDLLARRAGQPYDVLLTERVLKPLGMADTLVARNDRLTRGRMANGLPTANWDVPVAFAGAGGLRSTLDDMARFARAMLGDVPDAAPASLRTALVASMQKQRTANEQIGVGMAWHLRKRAGEAALVFHNGGTGGFSSMLLLDPAQRRAAVTLADAAGGFDDLAFHLLDASAPLQAPRKKVVLDEAGARAAAGRYELQPGFVLTLAVENGRLYAQATGQSRFELLQDSRGDYYALVADILIRIARTGDGSVNGLTLFQGGGAIPARRLTD